MVSKLENKLKHIPYGQQVGDELSVMTVTEV
jgi:hypothetical protein